VVSGWTGCTSPRGYALASEVDGDYTFEVVARDSVGNPSGAAGDVYTLDRSAPAAPSLDASPATPSADPSPSWSFSGEANAAFECRLTHGGAVVSDWSSCSGSRSYDLTGEPDGAYGFGVRARDEAGNSGAAATSSFVLDRSAPALPTLEAAPGVIGSSRSASWSFSGDADSTFECRLERGASVESDWATCASPRAYDLTGAPDGAYTFRVRARNPLGTPSAARSDVYTLDTAAPTAPAIATNPGSRGSTRAPVWSFTAEAGASFECRLETGGGSAVDDWAACASPKAYDLTTLDDGAYVFRVRAHDGAGNTSAAGSHSYQLDTTSPSAPDLTTAPGSPGTSRAPVWKWSGEAGASFECRVTSGGGDVLADWAACVTGQPFDLSGRADGTYTLHVRALDGVGNTGPARTSAYELDTTPGALQILSGPAPVVADRRPSWSFSGEAGAGYACRLQQGGDVVHDWSGCAAPHAYDLGGRPDGDYLFSVRSTDAAGNTGAGATWPFRLDTIAPPRPVVDAEPPARARDRTPEWSFSHESGAAFECRVEHGGELLFDWRPCSSPLKVDLRGLEDGLYQVAARAQDPAGNVGETIVAAYRLDTTDPAAPDITARPGRSGDDRKPRWAWRGEANATFDCRLRRGGDTIKDWRSCATPQAYDLGGDKAGGYTFSVRATDVAGNTGTAANDDYELKAAATSDSGSGGSGGGSAGSGGDGGSRGDGGSASSGGDAPAAAPGAGPAAPASAPPALKPNTDNPGDAGDDDAGAGGDAKGQGAGGRGAGAGAGAGGAAARRGGPGAAGGPGGGAGGGSDDGGKDRKPAKKFADDPLGAAGESVAKVAGVIAEEPEKTAFPMALIFVIAGFMGLQGRIDRNDPKLALAPVFADPDLEFRPPRDAREALEA
jgi:hypothetical protein